MARSKLAYAKLVLHGRIHEDRAEVPFLASKDQIQFKEVIDFLVSARKQKRVRTVVLVVKPLSIGWAQIEEIQRELAAIHNAGKKSVVFLESADNHTYYLACGAGKIYMPPTAPVEFVGLRAELHFFKRVLDNLGVSAELFSVGEFKSAAEIFTRNEMSEPAREMTESILDDMQSRIVQKVAEGRKVSVQRVLGWVNQGPETAAAALQSGMIDGVLYEDELQKTIADSGEKVVEFPAKKLRTGESFLKRLLTRQRPQIAFLVAEGLITQGQSRHAMARRATVGSETLKEFLERARKSKRVKAVVIRVNSPGGAALASDLIWREVKLTASLKPVVVSFGSVAASGGYYMSVPASRVLALPSSLTGSIGVVGGKFSVEGLLQRFGIGVDRIEKGSHSGYLSPSRNFSKEEAETVRNQMQEFYKTFVQRVAEGRRTSTDEIDSLGRGRVWTGSQASSRSLIDEIGGLSEAFSVARSLAGIPEKKRTRVVQFYQKRTLKDFLSLPFLESLAGNRVWAVLPFHWFIH